MLVGRVFVVGFSIERQQQKENEDDESDFGVASFATLSARVGTLPLLLMVSLVSDHRLYAFVHDRSC